MSSFLHDQIFSQRFQRVLELLDRDDHRTTESRQQVRQTDMTNEIITSCNAAANSDLLGQKLDAITVAQHGFISAAGMSALFFT